MGLQPPSTQVAEPQPSLMQAMVTQAKATQEPPVRKLQQRAKKMASGGVNSARVPASSMSNPSEGPRASLSKVLEETLSKAPQEGQCRAPHTGLELLRDESSGFLPSQWKPTHSMTSSAVWGPISAAPPPSQTKANAAKRHHLDMLPSQPLLPSRKAAK